MEPPSETGFRRLSFELGREAEDRLVEALWSAGTRGLEVRERGDRLEVDAFFDEATSLPGAALDPAAGYWRVRGCRLLGVARVEPADWLARYRESAVPVPVGRRLIVDPREPGPTSRRGLPVARAAAGRTVLRLPARTAFGTGSHESTRLAVELLDRTELRGLRVLDVGTGTGILAFAALLAGARSVTAVEIDPQAAVIAAQNQRLNGQAFALAAGGVGCLRSRRLFDLGLVNVLPEAIRGDLSEIAALVHEGGRMVLSGFLGVQRREVLARLAALGFAPLEEIDEGEWSAALLEHGMAG